MQVRDDTIIAQSTPAGRGAIAIIRLSGGDAHRIAATLVSPWPTVARRATWCRVRTPGTDRELDHALVTRFDAPHSYTGEDVVEIACHGGYMAPSGILESFASVGVRTALPGEFTQRAVLNGKMDLLQAEAIADLIDAQTTAQRQNALYQLDGGLSNILADLRERVLHVEALLAYDIDFPEEDDGPVTRETVSTAARAVHSSLQVLLHSVPLGEVVRDGALVVIAGPPNAGKSSLFNALLGETRAIVTDVPGTTRDAIEARVESARWPLRLVDTAGLRETDDQMERLGIEVSERHLRGAHLVLVCADSLDGLANALDRVREVANCPCVAVLTKCDLVPSGKTASAGAVTFHGDRAARDVVQVSATTLQGIDRLLGTIEEELQRTVGDIAAATPKVTRARHRAALDTARTEMATFLEVWSSGALPASVAAVHVRTAAAAIDELIGSVEVEDVLERVFRTFCVGK